MKHLYIPYPLAVIAKEKGFNETCHGFWAKTSIDGDFNLYINLETRNENNRVVSSPLHQQIIDWLREKHGIAIWVENEYAFGNLVRIGYKANIDTENDTTELSGENYYELLNRAIEQALKSL